MSFIDNLLKRQHFKELCVSSLVEELLLNFLIHDMFINECEWCK